MLTYIGTFMVGIIIVALIIEAFYLLFEIIEYIGVIVLFGAGVVDAIKQLI